MVTETAQPVATRRRRHELPLPVRAWVRIMRIYNRIDRRSVETMRAWDLSPARFDVINHAGLNDGATQQELADALLVTKGNVTQLLDSLERDGLIRREKCGRMNRIHLTDAGREVREHAMTGHVAIISKAMEALSPDEQHQLITLLRKLERSLDTCQTIAESAQSPQSETRTA
jgi:DNA-binding MarR family transcriptional regulator